MAYHPPNTPEQHQQEQQNATAVDKGFLECGHIPPPETDAGRRQRKKACTSGNHNLCNWRNCDQALANSNAYEAACVYKAMLELQGKPVTEDLIDLEPNELQRITARRTLRKQKLGHVN